MPPGVITKEVTQIVELARREAANTEPGTRHCLASHSHTGNQTGPWHWGWVGRHVRKDCFFTQLVFIHPALFVGVLGGASTGCSKACGTWLRARLWLSPGHVPYITSSLSLSSFRSLSHSLSLSSLFPLADGKQEQSLGKFVPPIPFPTPIPYCLLSLPSAALPLS